MFKQLSQWFNDRTDYQSIATNALDHMIPGGARWKYVFGSALTGTFLIQVVTGLLLMTSYVPSSAHAWGSVWYINEQMLMGKWIRGVHHFGSSAMMVLIGLHLLQVLFAGAYRRPREITWWLGMGLMFLVIGFGLTGYLLPWDQKGYWATKVATNIAGGTPIIGTWARELLVGGPEYGNQTLTRFYGLHVGVLPLLTFILIGAHIAMFRRQGVTAPSSATGAEAYWPRQFFMNTVATLMVFGVVVGIVLIEGGANLDAPADPASRDYPARPEWYFLSLFQLLQKPAFAGNNEVLGTVVVPGAIVSVFALLPLLDRVLPRNFAHFLSCSFAFALVGAVGVLMLEAIQTDAKSPTFQAARAKADEARERALYLAEEQGVPPEGAPALLQQDPYYHGFEVLRTKCLSCHYYDGKGLINVSYLELTESQLAEADTTSIDGIGNLGDENSRAVAIAAPEGFVLESTDSTKDQGLTVQGKTAQGESIILEISADGQTVTRTTESVQIASDLQGFGTREWLRGLLEDPSSPKYFGTVPQCGQMEQWKDDSELTSEELDEVADFFEEFVIGVEPGLSALMWEEEEGVQYHPGFYHFNYECSGCHMWGMSGELGTGVDSPNLYGWGSRIWTERMILRPEAADLYGYLEAHELMPGFDGKLTENDLDTVIRLLKGDFLPPERSELDGGSTQESPNIDPVASR